MKFLDDLLDPAAIASRISLRLNQSYTPRKIERRLQEWGFHKKNRIQETSELRLRIAVLFQMSYTDRNIVRQLQRDNLGILSERQVAVVRKKIRRMTVWDRRQADERLEAAAACRNDYRGAVHYCKRHPP